MRIMEELELERANLEDLIESPKQYIIKYKLRKPVSGLGKYIGHTEVVEGIRKFEIKPPTLAIMDRLSRLSLDLEAISQQLAEAQNAVDLIKGSLSESARKMAEYVAIATLGTDYYVMEQTKNGKLVKYEDKEALEEISNFLFTWLTPEELMMLSQLIIGSLGLENFLASMRLQKGTRTAAKKKGPIE